MKSGILGIITNQNNNTNKTSLRSQPQHEDDEIVTKCVSSICKINGIFKYWRSIYAKYTQGNANNNSWLAHHIYTEVWIANTHFFVFINISFDYMPCVSTTVARRLWSIHLWTMNWYMWVAKTVKFECSCSKIWYLTFQGHLSLISVSRPTYLCSIWW